MTKINTSKLPPGELRTAIEAAQVSWLVQLQAAYCKLWHRTGVQVSIPVIPGITVEYAGSLLDSVDSLLQAGWLVDAPSLEQGEMLEEIRWVCRLDHEGDEGITPTLLLYSSNEMLTYSYIRKYLNTQEDIKDFEHATGMSLDSLTVYPGNDHPQRGASKKTDAYIIQLKAPVKIVYRANPRFREAPTGQDNRSVGEKRKRDFVRWHSVSQPAANSEQVTAKPMGTTDQMKFIQECNDLEVLEKCRVKIKDKMGAAEAQPFLIAIRDRVSWLLRQCALEAKTMQELQSIEDESRKVHWALTVSDIKLIDQQILTTKFNIEKGK